MNSNNRFKFGYPSLNKQQSVTKGCKGFQSYLQLAKPIMTLNVVYC